MYLVIGIFMSAGGYLPVLFGQSAFGGWSILGTLLGGIAGIYIYFKLRQSGY